MPKDIDPQDVEWAAERLDPHDAMLLPDFDSQYKSLHETGDLVRVWNVDADDLWPLVDFLNYYTDVTNSSQTNFVEDPQVDDQIFEGRYRQAFVRVDTRGGSSRIIQVLRKGYLRTVDWDEARWGSFNRVVSGNDTADPNGDGSDLSKEQFYTARFLGVDPEVARAFGSSLENAEITDPTIDDETVTGTFAVIRQDHRVEEEDGSVTYEVLVADADYRVVSYQNVGTPEERTLTYIYNIPKKDIHLITAEFQADVGTTVRLSEEKRGGFFDAVVTSLPDDLTTSLLNVVTSMECGEESGVTNFYWGVEEAAIVALTDLTLEPGWTVSMSGPQLRPDGLFNYSYTIRKNVPKMIDWYDSVRNCIRNQFEQKFVDYDANDVASILFPENEAGVTIEVDRTKKAGCLEDIQIRKTETTEATVQHDFNTRYGTGTIHVGKYMRTLGEMPQGTAGYNTNVQLTINDDCTYNWVVISIPDNQINAEYSYVSQASCGTITATTYKGENVSAAPDYTGILSAAGAGYTIRVTRHNLNVDGTYDYTYTLFKDPQRIDTDIAAISEQLRSVVVDRYYKYTAEDMGSIVVPTGGIGKQIRVDRSIDEACLRDVTVTEVTTEEGLQRQTFNSRWGEGWIEVAKYQRSMAGFPETSSDYNNSISLSLNDDGTYNWVVLATPYDLRNEEYDYLSAGTGLADVGTTYKGQGVSTPPDFSAISLAVGQQLQVRRFEHLPDGKYDYEYTISKEPERDTSEYTSVGEVLRRVRETRYSAQVDAPAIPASAIGTTVRASKQVDQTGLIDAVIATDVTTPHSIQETFNSRWGEGTIYVAKYQEDLILPVTPEGYNTTVSVTINDNGTYNWVIVTVPVNEVSGELSYDAQIQCGHVVSSRVQAEGVDNQPDFSLLAQEDGSIFTVNYLRTRADGKYDYQYTVTYPEDRTIQEYTQLDNFFAENKRREFINQNATQVSGIAVPSYEQGTIVNVDKSKPVAGCLENIQIDVRTSKPYQERFYFNSGVIDIAGNQRTVVLPDYDSDNNNSLQITINPDGTYNWRASSFPKNTAFWAGGTINYVEEVREKVQNAGISHTVIWQVTSSIKYTDSMYDARVYIDGGYHGSKITPAGRGIYEAKKVTGWEKVRAETATPDV